LYLKNIPLEISDVVAISKKFYKI